MLRSEKVEHELIGNGGTIKLAGTACLMTGATIRSNKLLLLFQIVVSGSTKYLHCGKLRCALEEVVRYTAVCDVLPYIRGARGTMFLRF